MAICILNTVTESHEFTEDYFAMPVKSPAILTGIIFCSKEEGADSAKAVHDPIYASATQCCTRNLLPDQRRAPAHQHQPGRAGITVEMTQRACKGENCMMYHHSGAPTRELFRVRLQSRRRHSCLSVTGLLR